MYNVSLDGCTCTCNSVEVINATSALEYWIIGIITLMLLAGFIWLIISIKRGRVKKKEKYIEVKVRK